MITKTANLATRQVRYLEAGEGEPLVLLHAFPLGAEQWLPQLAKLPRGWRAIAPDLRGLGGSSPDVEATGLISVDTHAADVLELMAHLDMPRAVVCGLSMGGYIALAIVRKAASRVSGLVLADTRATADTPEGRAGRDRMLALLEREGPAGVANEMIPKLLGERTRREQPDLIDVLRDLILRNRPDGIAAAITALKERRDSTDLLPQITCPTLIIVGDEDVLTPPSDSQAMQAAIPGARLEIIPGAGHLSNLENPAAFSRALAELLSAVVPTRA